MFLFVGEGSTFSMANINTIICGESLSLEFARHIVYWHWQTRYQNNLFLFEEMTCEVVEYMLL
jgi:hypothetical protein